MPSRAEVEQAFGAIGEANTSSKLIPDREIIYSVWRDRNGSFGQVLDELIETIGLPPGSRTWMSDVDVASRGLLAYWAYVIGDIFRVHEAEVQGSKDYDERWIKVGDEELRLTVEQIEGPVDVTRYMVQRRTLRGTLFEESELVFDLDEQRRLEESLNPLRITNRFSDYGIDGVIIEYEVRYRRGWINMIRIVRSQKGSAGNVPNIEETTEFIIPPVF